jgi:hypothetical protein
VRLSVQEIRHLLSHLLFRARPDPWHWLLWSLWRRIHQAMAQICHYRRRLARRAYLQL